MNIFYPSCWSSWSRFNFLKKTISIVAFLLVCYRSVAQSNAILTLESGSKDRDLQTILYFERISYEKLQFKSSALVGKNYQITIKEFIKGTLIKTDVVFDSSEDDYFKLKSDNLAFAVVSKVSDANEFKISFQFNGFSVSRKYAVDSSEKDKFTLKSFFYKETQISLASEAKNYLMAFMTPYIKADKSEAYCEVAQSGIDPEHLYDSYKIPHYFLMAINFK